MYNCRTDYWKSNEKKYCDFCKCWITDNKITIATHEGGRKHKENVAKRISEINKKSTKDHKIQMKLDNEMSKMEKNAMASYLKDIASNADLTSQLINKKLAATNSTLRTTAIAEIASSSESKKSKWSEMKTAGGRTYYWNTETKETSWNPPPEGFVSLPGASKTEKPKIYIPEKKKSKKTFHPPVRDTKPVSSMMMMGPSLRGAPYGSWTPVVEPPTIDLQLPEQSKYVAPVVVPVIEEPEKKFKEKQVVKLEDSESVSTEFKKRKINSSAKRNVRQRLDDD